MAHGSTAPPGWVPMSHITIGITVTGSQAPEGENTVPANATPSRNAAFRQRTDRSNLHPARQNSPSREVMIAAQPSRVPSDDFPETRSISRYTTPAT